MINCSRLPALTQKTRIGSVLRFSTVTRQVDMGQQGEVPGYPVRGYPVLQGTQGAMSAENLWRQGEGGAGSVTRIFFANGC